MLCGSAFKNKGVQRMLDAVIEFLPSPTEVKAIEGILDDKDETKASREASDRNTVLYAYVQKNHER